MRSNILLLMLLHLHAGEGRELQHLSSFNFGDMSFSSDEAVIEDYVTLASAPQARHLCLTRNNGEFNTNFVIWKYLKQGP